MILFLKNCIGAVIAARLSRRGRLPFLCDRKRDMVISGGVNIYPAERENALIGLTGVRDCAVFGIPDEEFG
jgi:acyl-CoA synthetase (AMP-forming)/AMP-acid ligase II